jgi:hypothetical protein
LSLLSKNDKPWFLNWGKNLAAIFITPSSWGSQRAGHLPRINILFDDDEQLLLLITAKELEDKKKTKWPGSKVGRLCIPQNRALRHSMLMQDYFSEVPTCLAYLFHHRYRMQCSLFVKILETCVVKRGISSAREMPAGLLGFSGYQKISAAMRVLGDGIPWTMSMSSFASVKIQPWSQCVGFAKWWFVSLGPHIFELWMSKNRWGWWGRMRQEDGRECLVA